VSVVHSSLICFLLFLFSLLSLSSGLERKELSPLFPRTSSTYIQMTQFSPNTPMLPPLTPTLIPHCSRSLYSFSFHSLSFALILCAWQQNLLDCVQNAQIGRMEIHCESFPIQPRRSSSSLGSRFFFALAFALAFAWASALASTFSTAIFDRAARNQILY